MAEVTWTTVPKSDSGTDPPQGASWAQRVIWGAKLGSQGIVLGKNVEGNGSSPNGFSHPKSVLFLLRATEVRRHFAEARSEGSIELKLVRKPPKVSRGYGGVAPAATAARVSSWRGAL